VDLVDEIEHRVDDVTLYYIEYESLEVSHARVFQRWQVMILDIVAV
jgi:hypothetical protein